MPSFEVNLFSQKTVVAEASVSAIANILVAAGYSPVEIAAMFRNAADQIDSGAVFEDEASTEVEDESDNYVTAEGLRMEYQSLPEIAALRRISKRSSVLDTRNESLDLEKAVSILQQAMPLAERATKWLLEESKNRSIPVVGCHDDWLEEADDE